MNSKILPVLLAAASFAGAGPGEARLKDLASIEGFRDNQLIGYGVVVGLNNTGDRRQTVFSTQTLTNILERMGVSVPSTAIRVSNIAAVMVTAALPPLVRAGSKIDITVSAMGDATSLQGGTLLMCPLRAADGQVYAVAQGSVVLGGYSAVAQGSSKTLNHPTAGRVPNGASVEKAAPQTRPVDKVLWQLHRADFTTASRLADAINRKFPAAGTGIARAENAGLVSVDVPENYRSREIAFVADMESIQVEADRAAKVVVNERTGTIVLGKGVEIAPVSVMHGALTIEVQTNYLVSQPAPFSQGQTQVVPETKVSVGEEKAKSVVLQNGATVEQLTKALTAIGATPRDIVAILQSLKAAGALNAELEVI